MNSRDLRIDLIEEASISVMQLLGTTREFSGYEVRDGRIEVSQLPDRGQRNGKFASRESPSMSIGKGHPIGDGNRLEAGRAFFRLDRGTL